MTETMTIRGGLAYPSRMRRAWMPLVTLSLLAFGCAEQPRCEARGSASRPRVDVECNAGKVPVCGDDPLEIYSQSTGALLPVPPDSVANGSCAGIEGPCRPRVICASAGASPTCANGAAPSAEELNARLASHEDRALVNLASNEYFKAVRPKRLEGDVITCVFEDLKPGQTRNVISFMAKHARGAMARWIIEQRVDRREGLKDFAEDRYRFQPELSSDDTLVFSRAFVPAGQKS